MQAFGTLTIRKLMTKNKERRSNAKELYHVFPIDRNHWCQLNRYPIESSNSKSICTICWTFDCTKIITKRSISWRCHNCRSSKRWVKKAKKVRSWNDQDRLDRDKLDAIVSDVVIEPVAYDAIIFVRTWFVASGEHDGSSLRKRFSGICHRKMDRLGEWQ